MGWRWGAPWCACSEFCTHLGRRWALAPQDVPAPAPASLIHKPHGLVLCGCWHLTPSGRQGAQPRAAVTAHRSVQGSGHGSSRWGSPTTEGLMGICVDAEGHRQSTAPSALKSGELCGEQLSAGTPAPQSSWARGRPWRSSGSPAGAKMVRYGEDINGSDGGIMCKEASGKRKRVHASCVPCP